MPTSVRRSSQTSQLAQAKKPVGTNARVLKAKRERDPAFRHFLELFEKQAPKHLAPIELRKLARGLFGADAIRTVKLPGDDANLLDLDTAQIRTLAENPKMVREKLEALRASGAISDPKGWSAEDTAKLYARLARTALERSRRASFTVATVNDDFTDRKTNLRKVDADVMLVQEAKNTNIRRTLSNVHGVHQNFKRADKAGSAVVWQRDVAQGGDRGLELGVRPNGAGMLTRWITWTDVKIDGVKVRMISAHRPPKRFARLWPAFDRHLAEFVKRTKGPVIVGMDANQRTPTELAQKTGLKWHAPKGSIDGFLVSPGIDVSNIRRLPKGTSDHHPVVARFEIRRK